MLSPFHESFYLFLSDLQSLPENYMYMHSCKKMSVCFLILLQIDYTFNWVTYFHYFPLNYFLDWGRNLSRHCIVNISINFLLGNIRQKYMFSSLITVPLHLKKICPHFIVISYEMKSLYCDIKAIDPSRSYFVITFFSCTSLAVDY